MGSSFDDLEYLDRDEVRADFIPGGSIEEFVPGWGDKTTQVPGKETEDGIYIGMVRIWGGDRRIDRSLRLVDVGYSGSNTVEGELEEKMEFYFKSERFLSQQWSSSVASWHNCAVQLPEGVRHTLYGYIDLLVTNWCYDDINEVWWDWYQEEF